MKQDSFAKGSVLLILLFQWNNTVQYSSTENLFLFYFIRHWSCITVVSLYNNIPGFCEHLMISELGIHYRSLHHEIHAGYCWKMIPSNTVDAFRHKNLDLPRLCIIQYVWLCNLCFLKLTIYFGFIPISSYISCTY